MVPKYCPICVDPYDDTPVELDKAEDATFYCSEGCGFHCDKQGNRWTWVDKPFFWFWATLCVITLFRVGVQEKAPWRPPDWHLQFYVNRAGELILNS